MRVHSHNAAENRRYHLLEVKSGHPVSVRREKYDNAGLEMPAGM